MRRVNFATKKSRSPVGELRLVASDDGLVAITWRNDRPGRVPRFDTRMDPHHPVLLETERQLEEYFARKRTKFTVPLDLQGTPFQLKVWRALLRIPFGETRTYAELAQVIGHPAAARAVGAANGRNPISILCPCHRLIGTSGSLTGYAGGLAAKERLLELEQSAQGR